MNDLKCIEGRQVLTLTEKRSKWRENHCKHLKTEVSEELNQVVCSDCGERLNPIWVLLRFAREETRFTRELKAYKAAKEEYEKRRRTKCQHCGRMTEISHI